MRDAELQAKIEEERLENPIEQGGLPTEASLKEKMRHELAKKLHLNKDDPEDSETLDELILLFANDEDPEDDIFSGYYGNYHIGDGYVSSEIFEDGTDTYDQENLRRAIESVAVSKSVFGDQMCYMHGLDNDEQSAVMAYAAHLNDFDLGNHKDYSSLSKEVKEQMDREFEEMQKRQNPYAAQPTSDIDLSQDDITTPNAAMKSPGLDLDFGM